MPPLDQGPHLPGETGGEAGETVTRGRDKEEKGRSEMRDEDGRDWGIGRFEGREGNAFSSVKCDSHTLLYI